MCSRGSDLALLPLVGSAMLRTVSVCLGGS